MDETQEYPSENDATVSIERLVRLERDSALMLSYILDAKRLEIVLPKGVAVEDVNFGEIDVPSMIERLRRGESVDLSYAITESATTRRSAQQTAREEEKPTTSAHAETSTTLRHQECTDTSNLCENHTINEQDLSAAQVNGQLNNPNSGVSETIDSTLARMVTDANVITSELRLPDSYACMNEYDSREVAFDIVAVSSSDAEQLETVRIALHIGNERAQSIIRYAESCRTSIVHEGISARLHLRIMLSAIRDGNLCEDAEFYKRRCRLLSELLWSLQHSEEKQTAEEKITDAEYPELNAKNTLSEINRMLTSAEVDCTWVESAVEMIESVLDEKGGFHYPGFVGIKLYMELLSAAFDQVEDYTLAYDAASTIKSLEPIACTLGLKDEMARKVVLAFAVTKQAIAAYKSLGVDYDGESPVLNLLIKVREEMHDDAVTMPSHTTFMVRILLDWGRFMLQDFMRTVTPPAKQDQSVTQVEAEVFDIIVDITFSAARMLNEDGAKVIREACQKSACAEYDRLRAAAMENSSLKDTTDTTCIALYSIAQSTAAAADSFSAHLERYIANSPGMNTAVTGCFAARLGERFRNDLFAWLESGPKLTVQSLETIRSVGDLQNALVATGGDAVEPMNLDEHTSVLVFTWLNEKVDALGEIVNRCISVEKWNVTRNSDPVPSAIDFLRAVNETLDGFFRLKLPAHVSALRALTEGIDAAVGKYSRAAVDSLGQAGSIVPSIPVMTRYKKAIVADLHAKFVPEQPPRGRLEDGCVGAATVRLISLKFLMDKMCSLEKEIEPKWHEMQRAASLLTHPNARNRASGSEWFEGMMAGARQALGQGVQQVANQMAYSVIYRDLCGVVTHNIYAQGVHRSSHNMSTEILPYIDGVLGYVAHRLDSRIRNTVAECLLEAVVSGWMRALLNGGPSRVFVPADVELFEEEMQILTDFFVAGGRGLSVETVSSRTAPVSAVLSLMSLSTDDLCRNFQELNDKEKLQLGSTVQTAPNEFDVFNSDVVLRILCHRAEHAASKWIKAHFSIGKTESTGFGFGFL